MNRKALNAFICTTPERGGERRQFFTCEECGQSVDARNVEDVLRHLEHEQEPVALA